ncbi:MAG: hypothetical protein J4428_05780 [Candidatus Aenigmarchaeota archaeon]|nr:hypothetical protein [Candidatus Aenigmarchaeota archaeon]
MVNWPWKQYIDPLNRTVTQTLAAIYQLVLTLDKEGSAPAYALLKDYLRNLPDPYRGWFNTTLNYAEQMYRFTIGRPRSQETPQPAVSPA